MNVMSNGRARSRLSCSVLCRQRTRQGSEQRRVTPVQHFLLVEAQNRPSLRLAVCDVYQPQPSLCDGALYVANAEQFERRGAAVPMDAWMRCWCARSCGKRMAASSTKATPASCFCQAEPCVEHAVSHIKGPAKERSEV